MDAWREYFPYVLGVVVSYFGWVFNRWVKRWDDALKAIERHDRQIEVLISLSDRRSGDRRADLMDDYDGPNRRHGERRS